MTPQAAFDPAALLRAMFDAAVAAAGRRHRGAGDHALRPRCAVRTHRGRRSFAPGSGQRNVEFLLSLGVALNGEPGVWALAADTDGIDGLAPIAGAVLHPDTLTRAWAAGLNPRMHLDRHDGHGFFQALGDSVVTGPTLANVNDFRAILLTGRQ